MSSSWPTKSRNSQVKVKSSLPVVRYGAGNRQPEPEAEPRPAQKNLPSHPPWTAASGLKGSALASRYAPRIRFRPHTPATYASPTQGCFRQSQVYKESGARPSNHLVAFPSSFLAAFPPSRPINLPALLLIHSASNQIRPRPRNT
jgi:hypothetical protein